MDTMSPAQRSYTMSRIRSKDTGPELMVRKLVYSMGYRYRLHERALPGTPDLVFRGKKKVIFVHGCFWHRHKCARGMQVPKSRVEYWSQKLERNRQRDVQNKHSLRDMGWEVLTVWQCQLKDLESLEKKIRRFLDKEIHCR